MLHCQVLSHKFSLAQGSRRRSARRRTARSAQLGYLQPGVADMGIARGGGEQANRKGMRAVRRAFGLFQEAPAGE